jgi:hypothetical protein
MRLAHEHKKAETDACGDLRRRVKGFPRNSGAGGGLARHRESSGGSRRVFRPDTVPPA